MTANEQGRARIVAMALAEGLCVEQESKFDPSTIHIGGYIEGIERLLQRYAQETAERAPGVMTDERIDEIIVAELGLNADENQMADFARAVEQEVRAPLLAEVEKYKGYLFQTQNAAIDLAKKNAELERQLAEKTREAQFNFDQWQDLGTICVESDEKYEARIAELEAMLDTPHTSDWFEGVRLEAGHQIKRWGTEHDAGKTAADWFWLIGYLAGKALTAANAGNQDKALHHTISTGAALLNWHRAMVGDSTAMRPGIDTPTEAV